MWVTLSSSTNLHYQPVGLICSYPGGLDKGVVQVAVCLSFYLLITARSLDVLTWKRKPVSWIIN